MDEISKKMTDLLQSLGIVHIFHDFFSPILYTYSTFDVQ